MVLCFPKCPENTESWHGLLTQLAVRQDELAAFAAPQAILVLVPLAVPLGSHKEVVVADMPERLFERSEVGGRCAGLLHGRVGVDGRQGRVESYLLLRARAPALGWLSDASIVGTIGGGRVGGV